MQKKENKKILFPFFQNCTIFISSLAKKAKHIINYLDSFKQEIKYNMLFHEANLLYVGN